MDASLIAAPSSTKNRTGERNPEMRRTKKGDQWHFGMKAHIGVDAQSGLTHSLETTTANISDVATAHAPVHGSEERVWGDAGYQGVGKREENRDTDVDWQVAMKAGKRRLLDKQSAQEAAERRKASARAKVAHPFLYVKRHFGYAKMRYRGLAKNTQRIARRYAVARCGVFPSATAARRERQPARASRSTFLDTKHNSTGLQRSAHAPDDPNARQNPGCSDITLESALDGAAADRTGGTPMFMRDCWYAAAWDRELADGFVARRILDEPVLLFRAADGRVRALEDRCCHRSLPLSKGRLLENSVQCGYHGLEFAFDGTCVRVPGQSRVPPGARVRAYPIVERWRWVWIWMGEPAEADPDLVPDYHWNDDPGWTSFGDLYHVAGDYRLMNDNLLDLSHIQFLHADTLGAVGDLDADIAVRRGQGRIHVSRWTMDTPPSPFYAHALGTDTNVDRWQNITYAPPSHIVIDAGSALAGTGARDGDRSRGVEVYSNHTMTPETAASTHYFWHHARNFRRDDAAFTGELREMFTRALKQDVAAIEAQHENLRLMGDADLIDIDVDHASLQGRRLLDERIAAERGAG